MPANVALEKKQEHVNVGITMQLSCPTPQKNYQNKIIFICETETSNIQSIHFCN